MGSLDWRKRTCLLVGWCAVAALPSPAQTFTRLGSFDSIDGANPTALVQATDGNLYGTTNLGGANGSGTVFRITPSNTLTTLYSFCSKIRCMDGRGPEAGLIQATDGNFYGTTSAGGTSGFGTIFKVTPRGTLTTLYNFCSQSSCADGSQPYAGLLQATDGNFYGTTFAGGANASGTVFKIAPSGMLTTLYSFCSHSNCADGSEPYAGLLQATNGKFYGTTYSGGLNDNYGTVFEITPSGTLTTLYSFCSQTSCADGSSPKSALVQAIGGNFYGTTYYGGASGSGTVFEISPSGALTTLHSFDSTDGRSPDAGLVQATDRNLYGTTEFDGANGYGGTIFQITLGGTLTTLYSFCSPTSNCGDGIGPEAALIQDTKGNFSGTTKYGGANGDGTVFSLSMGLGPFVETLPTSGKVGATVRILGTSLVGTSSVTFNGTAAKFTVSSSSEITTAVPAGATTGTVQVVTPGGTLSSNVPFRVAP